MKGRLHSVLLCEILFVIRQITHGHDQIKDYLLKGNVSGLQLESYNFINHNKTLKFQDVDFSDEGTIEDLTENAETFQHVNNISLLHFAVFIANINLVTKIVENNLTSVNKKDKNIFSVTPLAIAVLRNDEEMVNLLINEGANIDDRYGSIIRSKTADGGTRNIDYRNQTALLEAIRANNANITEIIINSGANLEIGDNRGTPLIIAVKLSKYNISKLLLLAGADPDTGNPGGTPLIWAVKKYNFDILKLLLSFGADPNIGTSGGTPLMWSSAMNNYNISQLLLSVGADPNIVKSDRTALLWSIKMNNYNITSILLYAGADVNKLIDNDSTTLPIYTALLPCIGWSVNCKGSIKKGYDSKCAKWNDGCNMDILKLLFNKGALLNKSDEDFLSLVITSNIQLSTLLLNFGAKISLKSISYVFDPIFYNPISMKLIFNHSTIPFNSELWNSAFPSNLKNPCSSLSTPLSRAIYLGEEWIVKTLLDGGIDPNKYYSRCGPIVASDLLKSKLGDEKTNSILSLLLEKNLKLYTNTSSSWESLKTSNPLAESLAYGYNKTSMSLIENGVNVNIYDDGPILTVRLAIHSSCQVIEALIQHGAKLEPPKPTGSLIGMYPCKNLTNIVLQKIQNVILTSNEMEVEYGDEIVYDPQSGRRREAIVINWSRKQWYTYDLDSEVLSHKNVSLLVEPAVMMVYAPYPHPFLFMTDFRMFLINITASKNEKSSCESYEECQKVPDVFSLVIEKAFDVYLAFKHYSPVIESLYSRNSIKNISYATFMLYVLTASVIMTLVFIVITIPVSYIFYKFITSFSLKSNSLLLNETSEKRDMSPEDKCNCNGNVPSMWHMERELSDGDKKQKFSFQVPQMVIVACFYSLASLAILSLYPFTKMLFNALVGYLIQVSSTQSSYWIILFFKVINTLIIDYQPGSPCAGYLFSIENDLKLSFWMNSHENALVEFDKYTEQNNKLILKGKKLQHFLEINKKVNAIKLDDQELEKFKKQNELIFRNIDNIVVNGSKIRKRYIQAKANRYNPNLIWSSNWIHSMNWKTPTFIDVTGKSCALLSHILYILLFRHLDIFNIISRGFTGNKRHQKVIIVILFIILGILNILPKSVCLSSGKGAKTNLLLRIFMTIVITPSSILWTWFNICIYKIYIINILMKFCIAVSKIFTINIENLCISHLNDLILNEDNLLEVKKLIKKFTLTIEDKIENLGGHSTEACPTGSIFERYGKPLAAESLQTHLKSDYDIMFSIDKKELKVEVEMKNDEFLHLIVLNKNCKLLQQLCDHHQESDSVRLSADKAKDFLRNVIVNMPSREMQTLSPKPSLFYFQNIAAILLNIPKLSLWIQSNTQRSGPAANYVVRGGNLLGTKDWEPRLDCDFILSLDLNEWPESANEWDTRRRQWPKQDLIDQVVELGGQAVPKADPEGDKFCWRLSFSRGELLLAKAVPENARLVYLSAKLLWKGKLKRICPLIKSYHMKTLFYHFMESQKEEVWTGDDFILKTSIKHFLEFITVHINLQSCPHYFIKSINLFDFSKVGDPESIQTEMESCAEYLTCLTQDEVVSVSHLFGLESQSILIISKFKECQPNLYRFVLVGLFLLSLIAMASSLIIFIVGLFIVVAIVICFLYSSIVSVPLLLIIILLRCAYNWNDKN